MCTQFYAKMFFLIELLILIPIIAYCATIQVLNTIYLEATQAVVAWGAGLQRAPNLNKLNVDYYTNFLVDIKVI